MMLVIDILVAVLLSSSSSSSSSFIYNGIGNLSIVNTSQNLFAQSNALHEESRQRQRYLLRISNGSLAADLALREDWQLAKLFANVCNHGWYIQFMSIFPYFLSCYTISMMY